MSLELTTNEDQQEAPVPLVLVVAERVVHDALCGFSDLNVHPVAFHTYESFMVALEERTVPMHAHPTVVVCSAALPDDSIGLASLLHVIGEFMIVIGGRTPRSIPSPPTVNGLRAAIAATSAEQGVRVDLPDVPRGDARIVDMAAVRDLRSVLGVAEAPEPRRARRLANQMHPATLPSGRPDARPQARPLPSPQARPEARPFASPQARPVTTSEPRPARRPQLTRPLSSPPGLDPGRDLAPGPQVLCVYGPRSGVGTSTVAANMSARLAHRLGLRVLFVDLDTASSDMSRRLRCDGPTVLDALSDPNLSRDSLARWLHQEPASGFWALLAPPPGHARGDPDLLTPESYRRVLSTAVDFDVVVLDCPTNLRDPLMSGFALQVAHTVCVVVNNERSTLVDARRALDAMTVDRSKVAVLVNQKLEGVGMELNEVRGVLDGYPIAAAIPDDRRLHVAAANAGQLVALSGREEIIDALDEALGALLPAVAPFPGWRSSDQLARLQHDLDRPTRWVSWVRQAIRPEPRG